MGMRPQAGTQEAGVREVACMLILCDSPERPCEVLLRGRKGQNGADPGAEGVWCPAQVAWAVFSLWNPGCPGAGSGPLPRPTALGNLTQSAVVVGASILPGTGEGKR